MSHNFSIFRSPAAVASVFILLGIAYLGSGWVPKEWRRTLATHQNIIESLKQGTSYLENGSFSFDESSIQFTNNTNLPGQRALTNFELQNSFSPFDQFYLQGKLEGSGDLILYFDEAHQYSAKAQRDSSTGAFLLQGEVIQDTSPRLIILGPDPEDSSANFFKLTKVKLQGIGFQSYSYRVLRLLLIVFVWVLLILSPADKNWIRAILGMILLAYIVIRLSYVLNIEETPFADMGDYEYIALMLLEGKEQGHNPFFQSFYAHGLPYYVAGIYFLFGIKNMLALKIANVLLGLITTLAIYGCGLRVSGFRAGLIGAFLFAFSLEMTFWSAKLSTEHLFACVSILALFFVLQAWKRNKGFWFFSAGGMLGYLFIIRPVLHFFLLFLFLGFMLLHPSSLRKRLSHGALFLIGFLLVLSPWIHRGYERYGTLMLTGTGGWFSFVHQNNDVVRPGEFGGREIQDRYQTEASTRFQNDLEAADWAGKEAIAWVKAHPIRYLKLSIGRFRLLFMKEGISLTHVSATELNFISRAHYYLFHWSVKKYVPVNWLALTAFLLLLLRLPMQWKSEKAKNWFYQHLPLLFLFGMSLLYLLTLSFPRYRDPLLPLIYIMIGMAADKAIRWTRLKWR
ncbi:MAG: glycosyltransferase family 39 protein [SAR324 cluster bacterium]|nr:glycosyltransferase family 39 protein [SAR324 cluster bacterium]